MVLTVREVDPVAMARAKAIVDAVSQTGDALPVARALLLFGACLVAGDVEAQMKYCVDMLAWVEDLHGIDDRVSKHW